MIGGPDPRLAAEGYAEAVAGVDAVALHQPLGNQALGSQCMAVGEQGVQFL